MSHVTRTYELMATISGPASAGAPEVGVELAGWAVVAVLVVAAVFPIVRRSRQTEIPPTRDQRPFHICAGCAAYNARTEPRCWRCDGDLTKAAIEPQGSILGDRLAQMETSRGDEQ